MKITQRLEQESAREYAYRTLLDNIIDLTLAPGASVSEKDLAEQLGLSRTPVREALIELSRNQLVEIYPQRGCAIAKIDYSLVEEVQFLRGVLETAIVEQACQLAPGKDLSALHENLVLQSYYLQNPMPEKLLLLDNQFHYLLFVLCGKQRTYQLMKSMTTHFDRLRSISIRSLEDIVIVNEHTEILHAIEQGDAATGVACMKTHLSRYQDEQRILREKYPDYFA